MIGGLFEKIAAKGNGFYIGEMTGPGVERWHVFLHLQIGRHR